VSAAIFEAAGPDFYVPTEAALGPWSDQALHGSPPTMLMAREIERFPSEAEMVVTRLTIELLRPVGRVPLEVRSRMVRPGRKVQLVEASLWSGENEVARAIGLRIRRGEVVVPRDATPVPHPEPEALTEWTESWRRTAAYHVLGVEIVTDPGRQPGRAPNWAWFRLKLSLIAGEQPSPLIRVCAAADFPNGISFIVDPSQTSFVNPDLTIYMHRAPVDEWVMVDAHTWLESNGTGFAEGALYDRRGRIGRSLQSLIVEPRGG
jgi:hypothetical protein